jgi:hypothetical protein
MYNVQSNNRNLGIIWNEARIHKVWITLKNFEIQFLRKALKFRQAILSWTQFEPPSAEFYFSHI